VASLSTIECGPAYRNYVGEDFGDRFAPPAADLIDDVATGLRFRVVGASTADEPEESEPRGCDRRLCIPIPGLIDLPVVGRQPDDRKSSPAPVGGFRRRFLSFVGGIRGVLDLSPGRYKIGRTGSATEALAADWRVVMGDFSAVDRKTQ
jgi:hypothetical protein